MNESSTSPVLQTENWLLKRKGLSVGTKMVYFILRSHLDRETGNARVSQQEIAKLLGTTDRQVRMALTRLRQLKLISWARSPEAKTNSYSFRIHPWQGLAPHATGPSGLKGN